MLSDEQLRRFGDDGYLVVPEVVPEDLLLALDRRSTASSPPTATAGHGREALLVPAARAPAGSRCRPRSSGALDIAEALVAPHRIDHGLDHIQIALKRGARALCGMGGHVLSIDDPPRLRPPVTVTARRGDLLLAHFLLGHDTGGTTTDRVRPIAYYRLSCESHRSRWQDTFLDAFTEYAPVRRALR